MSFLAAFARGINFFASQELLLPQGYVEMTLNDVFTEWTTQDVWNVVSCRRTEVDWPLDLLMRLNLLSPSENMLSEYGHEPILDFVPSLLTAARLEPESKKRDKKSKYYDEE